MSRCLLMIRSNAKVRFRPCIRITCTDDAGHITAPNIVSYKSQTQPPAITKASVCLLHHPPDQQVLHIFRC